jgi:hypothetical protein
MEMFLSTLENIMTPSQKVKWLIVSKYRLWNNLEQHKYPLEDIDSMYPDELINSKEYLDAKEDVLDYSRSTNIPVYKNYKDVIESLGDKLPDGTWVGWTYILSGNECNDWINAAYHLNCIETEELIVTKTFSKGDSNE